MHPTERKLVRRDQIHNFLGSYFPNWRLNQILTAEKLLKEKYSFFGDIVKETKQSDDTVGEATIAQEITNGLHFDAISSSVQYIEDLFALLYASKNPDFFIKNIVTYSAGKVEAMISRKYNFKEIAKLFYFPYYDDVKGETETEKIYNECLTRLSTYIQDIQEYHNKHHFFYIQYKHGLTIALRPFNLYQGDKIEQDKNGEHKPYLVAFDNMALDKLRGTADVRFNNMAFMPGFTEPVRRNITTLHKENNLTRFVFPPADTNFDTIKLIAYKTKACIETIIRNLANWVNDKENELQLPSETFGKSVLFKFDKNPFEDAEEGGC